MKIVHVYKDYFPVLGGIENHIRDLARAQVRRGHEVSVLVTNTGRATVEDMDQGVGVIKAGRLAAFASTPISLDLFLRLRSLRPDVTHLHFPYPVGEFANLLFGGRAAIVISYHSDVVRQKLLLRLYDPILRHVLRRADRVLAASPPYVASSPYLQSVRAKTEIVPYGVDADRFAQPDPVAVLALRERLAPNREPLLISVGRLRYYKGLDVAIRALARVDDGRARLVLVGAGPMEAELRVLSRELGLGARVEFAGEIADEALPLWFHAGDVYVSSASHRSEAFGISIVEAMASSRPVISTELGTGTSFVNQHGETGLVAPANDPAALARAMTDLLADSGLRERFGAAARLRVEREFTLELMVDRVLGVYERVLAERSGGSKALPSG